MKKLTAMTAALALSASVATAGQLSGPAADANVVYTPEVQEPYGQSGSNWTSWLVPVGAVLLVGALVAAASD
ncbi:hypothetical protein ACMA5I_01080 [Paracoccaceae bacterium GXU_MW_L88]